MKVLDSDHCVALLRGKLDLRLLDTESEVMAVTAISVGELMHGVHKSTQVEENLARLVRVAVTPGATIENTMVHHCCCRFLLVRGTRQYYATCQMKSTLWTVTTRNAFIVASTDVVLQASNIDSRRVFCHGHDEDDTTTFPGRTGHGSTGYRRHLGR